MIGDCHQCELRRFIPERQTVVCGVDNRSFHDHNEANICPLGKFGKTAKLAPDDGMARTILLGMIGIGKAATGIGRAPLPVVAQRRTICKGCEHSHQTFGILHRCNLCGCALAAKTKIASEQCPAGKWFATPPASGSRSNG